jgi:hypothetical protein
MLRSAEPVFEEQQSDEEVWRELIDDSSTH